MASISTDEKTGRRRILFFDRDGRRRTLRLGAMPMKAAEQVRGHLLANASMGSSAMPKATAEWVADIGNVLRCRMERLGLVAPRATAHEVTVAAWIERYIASKVDAAESTVCNMRQAQRTLLEYLGKGRLLSAVTAADAEGYASFLRARRCSRGSANERMAEATVRRQCRRIKQFFAGAVDAELLTKNPFAKVKSSDVLDKSRLRFVTAAEVKALLDACPDDDFRLTIALAYRAGLRCPSEIAGLSWGDVNWQTKLLMVRSQKTRRDAHGGIRHVPLAPELAAMLLAAFSEAGEGAEKIISRPLVKANLRTTMYRLMDRAGIKRFGKPFQNLRCTCETNWLAAGIPEYQVSEWIGHDVAVSRRHYDITRAEYAALVTGGGAESGAQAAQNAAQQAAAGTRKELHPVQNGLRDNEFCEAVLNSAQPCKAGDSPEATLFVNTSRIAHAGNT